MSADSDSGLGGLRAALSRVEGRLEQIEKRLAAVEQASVLVTEVEPAASKPAEKAAQPARIPSTEPQVRAAGSPEVYDVAAVHRPVPPPLPPLPSTPQPGVKAVGFVAKHGTVPRPAVAARSESLETRIGKSWMSLVGGLFVLGAVLFFLKLAWDRGWLHPTPEARIAMALGVGAIFIGLGEWAFCKQMRALAASLAATGLATLMATFFAASVAFETPVIPKSASFICVLVVGIGGIGLSLQMRTIALTIVALLGMYLSPAVLGSHEDKSLQLMAYLGVVAAMGLGVCFFKRKWISVRVVTLTLTWLWVLGWTIVGAVVAHRELGVATCSLFFGMFLAEMVASLVRVMSTPATEAEPQKASPNAVLLESGASVLSFANTAAAMLSFWILFGRTGMEGLWMVSLGLAGAMGVAAFITNSRIFSIAAAIQAMALATLAVPLYFSGSPITLAWAIMGLALAVYVYFSDSRVARAWMIATFVLVVLRICLFDIFSTHLNAPLVMIGAQKISRWMLMGWCTGLYGLLIAWLTRERTTMAAGGAVTWQGAAWALATAVSLATFVWLVTCGIGLGAGFDSTLGLLVWSLGLMIFCRFTLPADRSPLVETPALVVLVIAAIKWLFYDGLVQSAGGLTTGVLPILNLFVLSGLLLIAALFASRTLRAAGNDFVAWSVAAIGFAMLNVESLRATDYWLSHAALQLAGASDPWIIKNVVISVLWGIVALAAIGVGFARRLAAVRWTAIVLLGATVLKVLIVDMAQVGTVMRVLSFMAVGVVLLLVSLLYSRVGRKMATAS
jgi:uncharacterized membrane protein